MAHKSQGGSVAVYTVCFLAVSTLAIALLVANASESPGAATVTALVAGVIAAIGIAYEARRDLDAALTFCSVVLLSIALITGIYLFSVPEVSSVALMLLGMTSLLGLSLGIWTFTRQRTESSRYPNVLAASFPKSEILEVDGVQYVGVVEKGAGSDPHNAVLILQNCFDAPRKIEIRLDAEKHKQYLRYQERVSTEIGPGQVVRVDLPVVSPTYEGQYKLFFVLKVSGSGGSRVRRWRAKVASTRLESSHSAALLAVGVVAWGGGVHFTIGPLQEDLWNAPLPAPAFTVLWAPDERGEPVVPQSLRA